MEETEKNKGSISMVEANLPPGFRFHPRDDELVCDYLMRRTVRSLYQPVVLIDVDLNKCEPWDIPQKRREWEGKNGTFTAKKTVNTQQATEQTGLRPPVIGKPPGKIEQSKETVVLWV